MNKLAVSGTVVLSADVARDMTDAVKRDLESMSANLLALYEGGAHQALGYESWGVYFEQEFGQSDATAYRQLQAARVVAQLPMGSPPPASERVTRELSGLLEEPERLQEVWSEAVEKFGDRPTAQQVREVRIRDKEPEQKEMCPSCGRPLPAHLQVPKRRNGKS